MPDIKTSSDENLHLDAGAGKSDYPYALIFTSDKFVVTAFGYDRDHCEDVLANVLRGRFDDEQGRWPKAEGDREFVKVD